MTKLLQQAFEKASALSEKDQDSLARFLMSEIEDDAKWETSFTASQDELAHMAKEASAAYLSSRITVDPEQCGGRPCIRGMRIRVTDVLDLFSSGLNATEILKEMPDLEQEDVVDCLSCASTRTCNAS